MAIESQSALANLAKDTIRVDATSADIAKAANAKAAAKPAAKGFSYHTKAISYHAKAAVAAHAFYFSVASGVIIGAVAYHLVKKVWLNKNKCC